MPWRDYKTFRSHWIGQGASGDGGWHKRRAILSGYFEPVFSALDRMEAARFGNTVAEAVSPAGRTGWQQVDACIDDVMVRFRSATSPADYQDVGRRSVALVEALSETVYVPVIHKRDGETEPPIAKTHLRIGRFIEDSLHGSGNAEARSLVRKTAEFAEAVKHRPTSTRRDAGIVADAVILLAHLLRRIDSA